MKRNSTEKSLKQPNSSRSIEKVLVSQTKTLSNQLPPHSNSKCLKAKNKKNQCPINKNGLLSTERSETEQSENTRENQINSFRSQQYNNQSDKENINVQQCLIRNSIWDEEQYKHLRTSRSTSSFQDKYQEIFLKLSGQNKIQQNGYQENTERNQQQNLQKKQDFSFNEKIFTQTLSQNSRTYIPLQQSQQFQNVVSDQEKPSSQLLSTQKSCQSLGFLQSSINIGNSFKNLNGMENNFEDKEKKSFENNLSTKRDNKLQNSANKFSQLKTNIDLANHKNLQIQELTKQNTQFKILNEKLQRKILELEYELENTKKESLKIDNIYFQEKVLEEKQISIRKSELEIEDLTRELKKESELIIKQRQQIQQDMMMNKKQQEILVKEQEKLSEEGKKLKLWEEKIQEQERLLREKIIKFENRDELLVEKEKSLKKFETQIEQKRIFVLQLIERLGQHDEQLYNYAKQCEQRCEKIDQFQNILYNQVLHHDDLDLRMEGLKLNESIFQKKMDLEMSSCINQVQKLKEKENVLERREKNIKQQQEKSQNQQKLAKSLDKPISFSEYSNLKQQGQLSKTQKHQINKIASNENNQQSTCCSSSTLQVSSQSQGVQQLQFKNKSNQNNKQNKSFKRISQQQQQNQSLQIGQINQQNETYQNDDQSNTRKRRSESHQNLSHQTLNKNSESKNFNFTLQNDNYQQQTTFLSFDNNLDLSVTQNQIKSNQIIKLNQFASQEDISVVLPPQNLQSNGILMTSYHIDEDIAYFCQDAQKETDQIKQISIIASPQQHYSEQVRQQQTIQDQYQTFQKDHSTENILAKAINSGSSGSKQSELKIDLSSLQTRTDNQNDKQANQQSIPSSNSQFLSVKYQQPPQQINVFTQQFNPCSIANEIIQDDNLLSNRDYFNADELELIRKNRKINQTPQTSQKQQKLTNDLLHEICQNNKGDKDFIKNLSKNKLENHLN